MVETCTIADVDAALRTLCQMLKRAVAAYDLPNVKHFLERIDRGARGQDDADPRPFLTKPE